MNLPRTLSFQGRVLNFSGRGRVTGSHSYLDLTRGKAVEMYVGEVVQTGHTHSLVQVHDNHTIPAVRVDHTTFNGAGIPNVGTRVLVGPIHYQADGPKADGVWRLASPPKAKPKPNRQLGVIGRIAPVGTFGQIIDQQGRLVFVHQNHCRPGVFAIGRRVSFVLGDQGRGPMAFDVASA